MCEVAQETVFWRLGPVQYVCDREEGRPAVVSLTSRLPPPSVEPSLMGEV